MSLLICGPAKCWVSSGESGSGKTTLLKSISSRLTPQSGEIQYQNRSLYGMSEADRRRLLRTEWGVVHQHPLDGLRRQVSAGGNIGERLMATGARHYGEIRATAQRWLEEVEIPASRIDDLPTTFSGGMQQRLQIARNLVTHPRLVFMDEPTGGLDVSVQARLLDLLRGLVVDLDLAVVIVTHDLGVARLLADRLLVMKQGASGGKWVNRPGARRSASPVYPVAGVVGIAKLRGQHDSR